jgi:hypothetical protein
MTRNKVGTKHIKKEQNKTKRGKTEQHEAKQRKQRKTNQNKGNQTKLINLHKNLQNGVKRSKPE